MTGWLSPSGVLTACAPSDKTQRAREITRCDDEARALTLAKRAGWLWVENGAANASNFSVTEEQATWLRAERKRMRNDNPRRKR